MPSVFKRINQAYVDADREADRRVIRNNYKFVSQNNQVYQKPSILDDITVFNIDKYFEELKSNVQNIIDNYLRGEKNNNASKVISIYNIIVSYLKNFAKDNVMSQRDKANIQDKFDEIKPIVKQVLDIAIKNKFSDVAQVEQLFENLDNRAYFEIKMTPKQVAEFNKKIAEVEKPKIISELVVDIEKIFNDLFTVKKYTFDPSTGKESGVILFENLTEPQKKSIMDKYDQFKNKVYKMTREPTINKKIYNQYFSNLYDYLTTFFDYRPMQEDTKWVGIPKKEGVDSLLQDEISRLEKIFREEHEGQEYYNKDTGNLKKIYMKKIIDEANRNISIKLDIEETTPEEEEKIINTIIKYFEKQGLSDEEIDNYIKTTPFAEILNFYNEIKMMKRQKKISKREFREREREEKKQQEEEILANKELVAKERRKRREQKLEQREKQQEEEEERQAKIKYDEILQKEREAKEKQELENLEKEFGQGKPKRKTGRPAIKKVGRPVIKKVTEVVKKNVGRPRKQILKSFIFGAEEENKKPEEVEFDIEEEIGAGKKKKYKLKQRGGNINKMKQKK